MYTNLASAAASHGDYLRAGEFYRAALLMMRETSEWSSLVGREPKDPTVASLYIPPLARTA